MARRVVLLALTLCLVAVPAAQARVERTGRYLVSFDSKRTAQSKALLGDVLATPACGERGPVCPSWAWRR